MPPTLRDLQALQSQARQDFMPWKQGIAFRDRLVRSRVPTEWPDKSAAETDLMVRNVYRNALLDKGRTAGLLMPKLVTWPTRGTKSDRAERNAEKRRRVATDWWHRSVLDVNLARYYIDALHAAAAYTMPWTRWRDYEGRPIRQRYPHFERVDPRFVYPLGHDSHGQLTQALIVRVRPLAELEAERGIDHASLVEIRSRAETITHKTRIMVQEVWYVDSTHWAVYVTDSPHYDTGTIALRTFAVPGTSIDARTSWIAEPERHNLGRCPLVELKTVGADDDYIAPLESVIPDTRRAHTIAAWALEEMSEHIFQPVGVRNLNMDEFGPGKIAGAVNPDLPIEIVYGRPPPNFEAWNAVLQGLNDAERTANQPEQRAGDPGASIVSDKGLQTLQGSFNAELADLQTRLARMMTVCTENAAAFDEQHCNAEKDVEGIESGKAFRETYKPRDLFDGDHRFETTFGAKLGLDQQAQLLRLTAMANMEALATRTLIREAGIVDDVLQEEREIGMERVLAIGIAQVAAQMQTGNPQAWDAMFEYFDMVDSDDVTHRVAMKEALMTINQIMPAGATAGLQAGAGPGDPSAAIAQDQALTRGAVSGPPLMSQLPPGIRSALAAGSPGGTG